MKNIIITLFILASALHSKAQVGYNYSQYEFGIGGAYNNRVNSDYLRYQAKYAANLSFTYNYTPFMNYVVEFQAGTLAGDSLTYTPKVRYEDQYTSLAFRFQLQAGELMDYDGSSINNALKNFYIGAGVGVIYTNTKNYSADTLAMQQQTSNIFLPLKIGYEFKVFNSYDEPWMKVDLGYQVNFTLTDRLDGLVSGNNKDSFTQFAVNLKFELGGSTSYRKRISY